MGRYTLNFASVSIPAGAGTVQAFVAEDADGDGVAETVDVVTLVDGTAAYTSANVFSNTGQVRVELAVSGGSDQTVTPRLGGPVEVASTQDTVTVGSQRPAGASAPTGASATGIQTTSSTPPTGAATVPTATASGVAVAGSYTLTFASVSIPAGAGTVQAFVAEDADGDGVAETVDVVTLVDGTTTYTTATGFLTTGQVRVELAVSGGSDQTVTPRLGGPVEVEATTAGDGDGTLTVGSTPPTGAATVPTATASVTPTLTVGSTPPTGAATALPADAETAVTVSGAKPTGAAVMAAVSFRGSRVVSATLLRGASQAATAAATGTATLGATPPRGTGGVTDADGEGIGKPVTSTRPVGVSTARVADYYDLRGGPAGYQLSNDINFG